VYLVAGLKAKRALEQTLRGTKAAPGRRTAKPG
jgi:hypothetical protein